VVTISIIDEIDVRMTDYARCTGSDHSAMLGRSGVFTRTHYFQIRLMRLIFKSGENQTKIQWINCSQETTSAHSTDDLDSRAEVFKTNKIHHKGKQGSIQIQIHFHPLEEKLERIKLS
jgi:hypothetical protein